MGMITRAVDDDLLAADAMAVVKKTYHFRNTGTRPHA
jgi:hypothetical protein